MAKSLRPCLERRCPVLVSSGRCVEHGGEREPWQSKEEPPRIRGRKLQALRLDLWLRDPACRLCRRVLALKEMIRDHVVPLAEGGEDIDENTQPLCQDCSDAKTEAESARGVRRAQHA